ncbi:MAG: phosphoribosylformylglycinamidine synthase subunit PurL [Thermoplasmatota archaeon]
MARSKKTPLRSLAGEAAPKAVEHSNEFARLARRGVTPDIASAGAAAGLKHLLVASDVPRERLTVAMARPVAGATGWERHVRVRATPFPLKEFVLSAMTDAELELCSKAMGIRLSVEEMKSARAYFQEKGRNPTDVELEALGQAWSEHCCYKSSKVVLRKNIYGIAEEQIICREDAGVLPFDGDWYYSPKLESHNHPSAIEPYGGAATGVGGVLRDVLCMGAQPVALVDALFFGPLDRPLKEMPAGVKHPRFLMGGVVSGIRDYGNRVGIPTVSGAISFHPGYTGNCLVNVGCVGVLHKSQLTHSRAGGVGDQFVYLGNPTGRDGIHGVAFASENLAQGSEEQSRSAVQVGDAIRKEPLIHATLAIIAEGLATGCKDFGGGGLSCVAGEMAHDAGYGCELQLEKVPVKVPGLAPWEIWVSESQERMMVTARPDDVSRILHIAKLWDVPAAVVGCVIPEPVNRATYLGEPVLEFDLAFSTGGPVYERPFVIPKPDRKRWLSIPQPKDLGPVLEWMACHPNVMSKDWAIRQYDHEVRAATVVKPLQGVTGTEGPGDAAVLKPVRSSSKGLAIACGVNPNYCSRDAYWGAAAAVDEAVRNLTAVGARLSSLCDNLNFGNPERPERMGELWEATRAMGEMARVLDRPYASGNVSLYNEGPAGPIPPTPTVMGVGIVSDFARSTTMDLKAPGSRLYLVGRTNRDLGGSLYLEYLGKEGERVPPSDPELLKVLSDRIVTAIERGMVASAHDCSEGGLAMALAEMAFAGDLGATIDISKVGRQGDESQRKAKDLRTDHKLFSESTSRWVVEVPAGHIREWNDWWDSPVVRDLIVDLGVVEEGHHFVVQDGKREVMNVDLRRLRDSWASALPRLMGVAQPTAQGAKPIAWRPAKAPSPRNGRAASRPAAHVRPVPKKGASRGATRKPNVRQRHASTPKRNLARRRTRQPIAAKRAKNASKTRLSRRSARKAPAAARNAAQRPQRLRRHKGGKR